MAKLTSIARALIIAALSGGLATAACAEGPAPGTAFNDALRSGGFGPDMIVIPAGRFTMGSPSREPRRTAGEGPQRVVTIAAPFAAARAETTVAEWERCVRAGACRAITLDAPQDDAEPALVDLGDRRGHPERPMVEATWDDAQAYAAWLSNETGEGYRLLSEAEWEYAARGETEPGAHPPYAWGAEGPVCDRDAPNGARFYGCEPRATALTRSFAPNAFGLFDMHGNAWEWVEDCWNADHAGAPEDARARTDAQCGRRVMRGGGYASYDHQLRAAFRSWTHADSSSLELGFRVARDLGP